MALNGGVNVVRDGDDSNGRQNNNIKKTYNDNDQKQNYIMYYEVTKHLIRCASYRLSVLKKYITKQYLTLKLKKIIDINN